MPFARYFFALLAASTWGPEAAFADAANCDGRFALLLRGSQGFATADFLAPKNAEQQALLLKSAFGHRAEDSRNLETVLKVAVEALPEVANDGAEPEAEMIARLFRAQYQGKEVKVTTPSTAGMSGASVWIVWVDGKKELVVKLYRDNPLSFAAELAGHHATNSLGAKLSAPELAGAFRVQKGAGSYPALVFRALPGEDAKVALLRLLSAEGEEAVKDASTATAKVAQALGEFHRRTWRPHAADAKSTAYVNYEVQRARTLSAELLERADLLASGWLTEAEKKQLAGRLGSLTEAFQKKGPTQTAFVHGDFHGGNVFATGDTISIIDLENSIHDMHLDEEGSLKGSADPVADVARFVESFALELMTRGAAGRAQAAKLEKVFMESYAAETGMTGPELASSVDFHRMRYDLVQLGKKTGLSPERQCLALDLTLRHLAIREPSAPTPCPALP